MEHISLNCLGALDIDDAILVKMSSHTFINVVWLIFDCALNFGDLDISSRRYNS